MSIFRKKPDRNPEKQSQRGRSSLGERPAWRVDGASAILVEGSEDLKSSANPTTKRICGGWSEAGADPKTVSGQTFSLS